MLKTAHEQRRYDALAKRGEAFQAIRMESILEEQDYFETYPCLYLEPEGRRVFTWEWMAEQGIEGSEDSIYDQLQAVLDAEGMTHQEHWTLLRPGMGSALVRWDAPLQTYLGNWPHKGTLNLRGSTFTQDRFTNINFLDVDMRGSALVQCSFKDCDLRGLRLFSETPCLVERCFFQNCWLPREFEHCFDPMLFQRGGNVLSPGNDQPFLMPGASTR